MSYYDSIREMVEQLSGMLIKTDEMYNFLPRNDYYRVKQLFTEAKGILEKHKGGAL